MSHRCILAIGMESNREHQLQLEWFRSHLKVPLMFRRTGHDAFNYLNAVQKSNYLAWPRPVMLVIDWGLSDMPAFLAVKQIRSQPRFRELLIIACHNQWPLVDQRLAYTTGVDACIECPDNFGSLLDRIRRIEEYWYSEEKSGFPAGQSCTA